MCSFMPCTAAGKKTFVETLFSVIVCGGQRGASYCLLSRNGFCGAWKDTGCLWVFAHLPASPQRGGLGSPAVFDVACQEGATHTLTFTDTFPHLPTQYVQYTTGSHSVSRKTSVAALVAYGVPFSPTFLIPVWLVSRVYTASVFAFRGRMDVAMFAFHNFLFSVSSLRFGNTDNY